ncbi:haloacid dehalogenase [Brachybacterium vulturis]|uniref:Haloacid dehalogenase n=1 Tax=Brachybacterium vulturis TaxID=2017484 RepID=A0A291GKI5_9MICO|nr:HAD-IA family hydrolase [Brachybacterium vulturis]ATG50484.1 haloacid dehalogenase [Brachybacterium vulturis]
MSGEGSGVEHAVALLRDADAVLLDFNGTLSLDEDLLEPCYGAALEHLGLPRLGPTEYADLLGLSEIDIAEHLLRARAVTGRRDVLLDVVAGEYGRHCRERPRIPAAHVEVVRALHDRGLRSAIATGTLRAMIAPVLAASPLGAMIDVLVTIEDVRRGKPDPEGFLRAAELLGADPARTVVLEDSRAGVAAARAAGAAVIGCGDPTLPADCVITSLGALHGRL